MLMRILCYRPTKYKCFKLQKYKELNYGVITDGIKRIMEKLRGLYLTPLLGS
jgi:hypothetical protein